MIIELETEDNNLGEVNSGLETGTKRLNFEETPVLRNKRKLYN